MRLNPVSLIFLPGAILAGYLIGGAYGAGIGLLAWAVIVGVASVIGFFMRRRYRTGFDDAGDESASSGRSQNLQRVFPHSARR